MHTKDPTYQSSVSYNNCDKYPVVGLRVLAIDDNVVCLKWLCALLKKSGYVVISTTKANEALQILRKNKDNLDIVITDVKRDDMDGFKLLEIISFEMDIPVIMMSADDCTDSVMKGIKYGARGYLLKPVRLEEVKILWQHVVRKNYFQAKNISPDTKVSPKKIEIGKNPTILKRQKDSVDGKESVKPKEERDDNNLLKKQRVSWSKEIHSKFIKAIQQVGENAGPKKILEFMNEPKLTRENVASHLQKYKKILHKAKEKTENTIQEQKNALRNLPCSSIPNRNYRSMVVGQSNHVDHMLNSFGAYIRSNSNTKKSEDMFPKTDLQHLMKGANAYSNHAFDQNHEANWMRSISNRTNDHANIVQTGFHTMHRNIHLAGNIQPNQVLQQNHESSMTDYVLPYTDPFQMLSSSDLGSLPEPNSLPMIPTSCSKGLSEESDSLRFNEKGKTVNISADKRTNSIDNSNWDIFHLDSLLDKRLSDSTSECNIPFSSLEDNLAALFSDDKPPTL